MASAQPRMWATMSLIVQRSQSVGLSQSSGSSLRNSFSRALIWLCASCIASEWDRAGMSPALISVWVEAITRSPL